MSDVSSGPCIECHVVSEKLAPDTAVAPQWGGSLNSSRLKGRARRMR